MSRTPDSPLLAVSLGCPSGVGPEVAVAGAALSPEARCLLVGDEALIRWAARLRDVPEERLVLARSAGEAEALAAGQIGIWAPSHALAAPPVPGKPDAAGGAAQLAWIDEALSLVQRGLCQALVTGPASKHSIASSGAPGSAHFRGHTEHLAERTEASEVVMAFTSPELVTALVTTHLPLAEVPAAITPEAVARTIFWLGDLLARLGHPRPRVAVAALNPHAGEGGLLGSEEITRIAPGVALGRARLRAAGIAAEVTGPLGAETAFRLTVARDFDGVVAMYHDQATIPCKLLGFGEAVNVTLGLPVIRTSVDHGTAYDRAGTGKADPRGMREAIALAVKLAAFRRAA
ncbi:MAG: 4-hydroxythreonine-4-phosphate dehydrogenase PdxA [Byssovorax sp.]